MNLISLQLKTTSNYEANLSDLIDKINNSVQNSIILAPELALTGYAYDDMENAFSITEKAIEKLIHLSSNKTIAITLLEKQDSSFLNTMYVFHNNMIIHKQSKHKLFLLGDEHKYFIPGKNDDIKLISINGLKVGILICFEIRFIELLVKLKGADIILIPAMWGKNRKDHLNALTKALAITHQCYVVVSDSANDDMAKSSGIITPFGEEFRDDSKEIISLEFELEQINKMRRYINIGLANG